MTGRNERCPCGSGEKFKRCCLNKQFGPPVMRPGGPPLEIIAKAMVEMRRKKLARDEWIARYGHVRPCIHTDNWGKKFIAVGSQLVCSDNWKFIPDFLLGYVPGLFGREWWDAEVAKPETEWHQVFQWRTACLRQRQTARLDAAENWSVVPNSGTTAYLSFAFSLFAIADNGRLDERLVQRLKHRDQFQGAWHEVFVEATCLRAGFTIEREDESDISTRHAEFTATHRATGEKFSVEAKSKHRPGVLGFAGAAQPYEKPSLAFDRLISDAVAKNPKYPLVIFLDTNLPFRAANRVYGPEGNGPAIPSPYIKALLARIDAKYGSRRPFVMLALTNNPDHYVAGHEPAASKHIHTMMTENPAGAAGRALSALHDAVPLYGNIPNEFPDF